MSETSKPDSSQSFSAPLLSDLVVVGLGGNQGDVPRCFSRVLEVFRHEGSLVGVSGLYRSAPMGPPQPHFLNAAFALRGRHWWRNLSLSPLLQELQRLEATALRLRAERWGPRTLDLDVLWAGSHAESSPELTVPHPRLVERRFAILPLLDLVPGARIPGMTQPLSSVLTGISGQEVERVAGGHWWEELPTR